MGADDARDGVPAVLAAVKVLQPLMVEIDSVVGILKYAEVMAHIIDALTAEGYWVQTHVLTASEYGVPQTRRRVFFIASLLGPVAPPAKSEEPTPTVGDTIGPGTAFDAFRTHHD